MSRFIDVFWIFLKLGCTSFGGPIAHLMYFRTEFVEKRKWLAEHEYMQLVTLCQTLPGPASSQVGFAIGLQRCGILGGVSAFIAFTLPSIILLLIFAHFLSWFDTALGVAALKGLAILALVVVMQGLLGMGKQLCSTKTTFSIAALSFICLLLASSIAMQLGVIALGLLLGYACLPKVDELAQEIKSKPSANASPGHVSRATRLICLGLFVSLFLVLPVTSDMFFASADGFYRSGALVFGGGHVVLPLLEQATVAQGLLTEEAFLAGYGATQAVPGPMFSFAAYLGFIIQNGTLTQNVIAALWATLFVFLPGFLLLIICLPYWQTLAQQSAISRAFAGANAAVVGLLAATLYNPIFTHAIGSSSDLAIAALAFTLLTRWKIPVLAVVFVCVGLNMSLVLL
jgi:chromate transporter